MGNAPLPLQNFLNNPYNRQQALGEFEKAGIKGDAVLNSYFNKERETAAPSQPE